MKSRLTYKAFLFPLLAISLIVISTKIILDNYPIDILGLRWIDYFMVILFSVTLIWLIKFETFRKLIVVEVNNDKLLVHMFIFHKRQYDFNSLVGFKTQIESSRLGNYEETIIVTKDNSKIILSEFFIDNYKDIKTKLTTQLKDNGGERKNAL